MNDQTSSNCATKWPKKFGREVVVPRGFEPRASASVARRSIQLSYGTEPSADGLRHAPRGADLGQDRIETIDQFRDFFARDIERRHEAQRVGLR